MGPHNLMPDHIPGHGFPFSRDWGYENFKCSAISCILNVGGECCAPFQCSINPDGKCKNFKVIESEKSNGG